MTGCVARCRLPVVGEAMTEATTERVIIRRFRLIAVTRHALLSPLSVEECADRLWQATRAGGSIPWLFRDVGAIRREQETRRPEEVGSVTREGFVLHRFRPETPALPILARGEFRPTREGKLIEVTLGSSQTHVSLLVAGSLFFAVLLGVIGILLLINRPVLTFDATRVLPAFNLLLLFVILVRAWRVASDEERARRDQEALLSFVHDTLQAAPLTTQASEAFP